MTRMGVVQNVEASMVAWSVIRDRRLSPTDLGVYVRFVYAAQLFDRPDLECLVREFKMPRAETEAALQRLVALELVEAFPTLEPFTFDAD